MRIKEIKFPERTVKASEISSFGIRNTVHSVRGEGATKTAYLVLNLMDGEQVTACASSHPNWQDYMILMVKVAEEAKNEQLNKR